MALKNSPLPALVLLLVIAHTAIAVPEQWEELDRLSYESPGQALTELDALPDQRGGDQTWAALIRAQALYHQNRFADAQGVLIRAEARQPPEILPPAAAARMHRLMGQNFFRMGAMNEAMKSALRCQELAHSAGLAGELAQTRNLLAAIHLRSGDMDEALALFTAALDHFERVSALPDIAKLKTNLGALHIERGDLDIAQRYLREALALGVELDRSSTILTALVNLIELESRKGDFAAAAALLEECLTVSADSNRSVWCREAAAEMHASAGDLQSAATAAAQALAMAREQQLMTSVVSMGRKYADLLEQMGHYREALSVGNQAFRDMAAIKDRTLELKLEEVRALHEIESARAALGIAQAESRLQAQRQAALRWGLAVLFVVLVGVVVMLRSKQRLLSALRVEQGRTRKALTSMQEAKEAYRHLSRIDPLTNRRNRRAFLDDMRSRSGQSGVVLMMDIDHFKLINDAYGHEVGDAVLIAVARALAASLPGNAVLARWGGEEFIAWLPVSSQPDALVVADRLREVVETTQVEGLETPRTISVGVSSIGPAEVLDEAIREADRALYAAKEQGRNQVQPA